MSHLKDIKTYFEANQSIDVRTRENPELCPNIWKYRA